MKKLASLSLALVAIATLTARAATLPASEDSYGYRAKLTLVANRAVTLPVDATHRAFLYFNLGDLPAGAQIRYARLRLYLPRVVRAGGGLNVHQVTGTWDETLASAEPAFNAAPVATISPTGIGTKRFVSVDVTAAVQGWIASPPSNEGFAIAAIPGATAKLTASVSLGAKEGAGSGYPAELDVEIADDPIAPGAIGTTQIAAGAVQSGNIASGAVGNSALADGSVTTPKLATAAVTDEKIASISGAKASGAVANATNAATATAALTAGNAITVNGIAASATPTPNTLLALDGSGKFPGSVVSFGTGGGFDADLLDGLDSSVFLNKVSGDTMPGVLTATHPANYIVGAFTATNDADIKGNILKNPVFGMLLHHAAFGGSGTAIVTAGTSVSTGTGLPSEPRPGTFLSARVSWANMQPVGHVAHVMLGTSTGGFGFKGSGNALKGITNTGGAPGETTEVDLATPLNLPQPTSLLAVRRATSVEFYVNGVLKGSSSSNLVTNIKGASITVATDGSLPAPLAAVGLLTFGVPMF